MTFQNKGSSFNVNRLRDLTVHTEYVENVFPNTTPSGPICFRYQVPVEDFIGRSEELQFLRKSVTANVQNNRRIVIVVSGLGGIGKTQLVKKFIEDSKATYRNVIWINSEERGIIEKEFKELAKHKLNIPLRNLQGEEKDFRSLIEEVFGKLSESKTLIVFDNVDKIENTEFVVKMGTLGVAPHIVITSRIQEWSDSICHMQLDVFSYDDALEYVLQKLSSSNHNNSTEDLKKLVEKLQNFPIALRQATAYITHHRKQETYNISDYINDYNTHREQLLASKIFQADLLNQYTETTLTTWEVTMNAINKCGAKGDLAHRILRIIAHFYYVRIRRDIFFNLKDLSSEEKLNENDVKSAVRLLINYSMVDSYEQQSMLSVHRLVQDVIRIQMGKDDSLERRTLREGLRLISELEQQQNFQECHEHGISVFLSALKFSELIVEFKAIPEMILKSLNEFGETFRALNFATEISPSLTSIFGQDHPQSLTNEAFIAYSYFDMGKYSEALQRYEEVFEKRRRTLGEDHPSTLSSKANIADSYSKMGKHFEALELYEEVLEKMKVIVGEDHPHTLINKSRIGDSFINLAKYSEALEIFVEVFEKQKTILGDDHPNAIISKSRIADSYSYLGNDSEALETFEEVLEKLKTIVGDDHPNTLSCKAKMAGSYSNLGKHARALEMYKEVFEKMTSTLGPDHLDTLITNSRIADSYRSLGKYLVAFKINVQVLKKMKTILGEDHLNTLNSKSRIADSYSNLGKYSEAHELYEDVFEKEKIIFGEDHPNTLMSKSRIALSYCNLGRYFEALKMNEDIFEKQKIVLGEDHPNTLVSKSRIADSYSNLGKYSDALELYEDVFAKEKIILGEDHPNTLISRSRIAESYSRLGENFEALQMYQEVVEKVKEIINFKID